MKKIKKLIKNLEGIGFEWGGVFRCFTINFTDQIQGHFWSRENDTDSSFRFYEGEDLEEVAGSMIENPTFEQILAAIKEKTGQDLTPKKTKKLKQIVAHNTARGTGNNADIIQNRRDIKKFNSNVEAYRTFSEGTKDELKERIEKLEAITKGLNLECRADDSSIESTKPPTIEGSVFEHGTGETRKVSLHHAPKEQPEEPKEKALGLGVWVEALVGQSFKKGAKLLIITANADEDGEWSCTDGINNYFEYYKPEDLKAL